MSFISKYELRVISQTSGDIIYITGMNGIDGAMQYDTKINEIGKVSFIVILPDDWETIFAIDNIVEVYRRNTEDAAGRIKEESYLIRNRAVATIEGVDYITVGGLDLKHFLVRRVINPEDDPLEAGGYSTKLALGSNLMQDYIQEQIGILTSAIRKIANLTTVSDGSGSSVGMRLRYDSFLFKALQDIAEQGDVDFEVSNTGVDFIVFCGQIGTDRIGSVVLTDKRANLINPILTMNRDIESNFVYVLGEGDPANQSKIELFTSDVHESIWNRFEFTVKLSNSDNSSIQDMINQGRQSLLENIPIEELQYEVIEGAFGSTYNSDWFLGDRVKVDYKNRIQNMRIIGVNVQVTVGGETITPSVKRVDII